MMLSNDGNPEQITYTALFPFCGIGAGALGFLQAVHPDAKFVVLGGIDFDEEACRDFERLTKAPAWCADVLQIRHNELRARYGVRPPDMIFFSPPCQGASGLLSNKKAETEKYQAMNELAYVWTHLMLSTWVTERPKLILLENVPRIRKRASKMLAKICELLRSAGYVISEGSHDCGEIGGLGQRRKRYLLVARHKTALDHYLFQPPKLRVRGCGEILETLPLPGDPTAGPLHKLPNLSWRNWVRLALIPPGGDWRDIPRSPGDAHEPPKPKKPPKGSKKAPKGSKAHGPAPDAPNAAPDPVVQDDSRLALGYETRNGTYRVTGWADSMPAITGQSGRPNHCSGGLVADPRASAELTCTPWSGSYGVASWWSPLSTVTASSSIDNSTSAVGDPRVSHAYPHSYGVLGWGQPSFTVSGTTSVGCGAYSVADPRLFEGLGFCKNEGRHTNKYRVTSWDAPARAVIGAVQIGSGAPSVADPRASTYHGSYGVLAWDAPARTITGGASVSCGTFSVADPRRQYFSGSYGVLAWSTPARAVTGEAAVSTGTNSVADPRGSNFQALSLTWLEAAEMLRSGIFDADSPLPLPLFITAGDGTWHRPLTTLELALLQGLPAQLDGKPLSLTGTSAMQRKHIGNAVPVQAAKAIAEQMLRTLVAAHKHTPFRGPTKVWVKPRRNRPEFFETTTYQASFDALN